MEIGMLNFWLELLVTAQTKENYFIPLSLYYLSRAQIEAEMAEAAAAAYRHQAKANEAAESANTKKKRRGRGGPMVAA